jgi:hypothetical protein
MRFSTFKVESIDLMRPAADTIPKKPYDPPRLSVYGDLTELTKGKKGNPGMFDNGVSGPKT